MNKYRLYSLLLLIVMLWGFNYVQASNNDFPLIGKVIYLDAGHGGKDPGAIYKDLKESDINLQITKLLQKTLEFNGAIVYITREGDYDLANPHAYLRKRSDLSARARIINESMADIYISIHLNAEVSNQWRGAQVFYDDVNPKNKEIAEILQKKFKDNLSSKRENKEIDTGYMYRNIKIPGVLVEVGFLTNPSDRYLLKQESYQQKVVNNIVLGIIEYFN